MTPKNEVTIEECGARTNHAQVVGTWYCACGHAMYDDPEPESVPVAPQVEPLLQHNEESITEWRRPEPSSPSVAHCEGCMVGKEFEPVPQVCRGVSSSSAEELARRIAEGIHAQMRVEDRIYYDPERFAAIALASLSANTGQKEKP